MPSPSLLLDTAFPVVTPEGVPLELRLAGPAARTVAYFVDAMIRMVVVILIGVPMGWFRGWGMGIYLLGLFVLEYFYFVAFEIALDGQSPGKRACSLRVVSASGTPLSWQQSLLRNLLRPADQLPFLYGVGGVLMLSSRHFQRLGDVAAGTVVIREDPVAAPPALPHPIEATAPLMRWIPNDVKALREVQRASDLYARRRERLSPTLRRTLVQPILELIARRADLPPDADPDLVMSALHRSIWGAPAIEDAAKQRSRPSGP